MSGCADQQGLVKDFVRTLKLDADEKSETPTAQASDPRTLYQDEFLYGDRHLSVHFYACIGGRLV